MVSIHKMHMIQFCVCCVFVGVYVEHFSIVTESFSFGVTDSDASLDDGGRFVFDDGDAVIGRVFIFENCLV